MNTADIERPQMTALVCTRNRGESVVRTVRSILANEHGSFEVIVVDQSTDGRTSAALEPMMNDPRLRHCMTGTVGISRARNIGIKEARAEIVAITDDDCEVPRDWLAKVGGIFHDHCKVSVAFYNVEPAQYDPKQGFIPAYRRRGDALVTRIGQKCRARGIGAGMAVRRSSVLGLGGFDESLGSGAPFSACEDGDLAVRAILHGQHVLESDRVSVLHYGYRTYDEGRALTRRDWFGIGAAYAKPFKCGRWDFWPVPAYELFVMALWPLLRDVTCLRRPRGIQRTAFFVKGFWAGWRTPVSVETGLFCGSEL